MWRGGGEGVRAEEISIGVRSYPGVPEPLSIVEGFPADPGPTQLER